MRVKRELKEEAERLGIDFRAVVERALEEEIRKIKRLRFKKLVDEALDSMNVSVEVWMRTVKESRAER